MILDGPKTTKRVETKESNTAPPVSNFKVPSQISSKLAKRSGTRSPSKNRRRSSSTNKSPSKKRKPSLSSKNSKKNEKIQPGSKRSQPSATPNPMAVHLPEPIPSDPIGISISSGPQPKIIAGVSTLPISAFRNSEVSEQTQESIQSIDAPNFPTVYDN